MRVPGSLSVQVLRLLFGQLCIRIEAAYPERSLELEVDAGPGNGDHGDPVVREVRATVVTGQGSLSRSVHYELIRVGDEPGRAPQVLQLILRQVFFRSRPYLGRLHDVGV